MFVKKEKKINIPCYLSLVFIITICVNDADILIKSLYFSCDFHGELLIKRRLIWVFLLTELDPWPYFCRVRLNCTHLCTIVSPLFGRFIHIKLRGLLTEARYFWRPSISCACKVRPAILWHKILITVKADPMT